MVPKKLGWGMTFLMLLALVAGAGVGVAAGAHAPATRARSIKKVMPHPSFLGTIASPPSGD